MHQWYHTDFIVIIVRLGFNTGWFSVLGGLGGKGFSKIKQVSETGPLYFSSGEPTERWLAVDVTPKQNRFVKICPPKEGVELFVPKRSPVVDPQ